MRDKMKEIGIKLTISYTVKLLIVLTHYSKRLSYDFATASQLNTNKIFNNCCQRVYLIESLMTHKSSSNISSLSLLNSLVQLVEARVFSLKCLRK